MNASLLRRSIPDNLSNEFIVVPTLTMPQVSHRLAQLRLLNSTSKKEHSWENPEASIGEFCRTMGRSQCWHAQGPARDLFIRLADEVKRYLDRNCEPPSRELHWSLYMISQTKSTARPVLMFICEERNSRKTARKTIKQSGILLRYPGVDTADCSHPPDFGQLVQLAMDDDWEDLAHFGSWSMDTEDSNYSNVLRPVFSHRKNLSGTGSSGYSGATTATSLYSSDSGQLARQPVFEDHTDDSVIKPKKSETSIVYVSTNSILGSRVFVKDSRGVYSPSTKTTAGAVVKLGDKICFLTAAHQFESRRLPSDSCPPFEYDIDGESESDDEDFLQTIRRGSRSPLSKHSDLGLEELESSISRSGSSQESELNTGDTGLILTTDPIATVKIASEKHGSFQQPIGRYLRHQPSTLTEGSLKSGTLVTTSAQGSQPGLDYALIQIEPWNLDSPNQIFLSGNQYRTLIPTQISDSGPKDADIVAVTGSSGILNGRLLGTPSFSRAPDQRSQTPSQELWTVKFDGKIEEGDCGTCVFDAQTGDLYGHVVSGNPNSGYAYIVPAHQIRDDLWDRFGEDLQLHMQTTEVWDGQSSTVFNFSSAGYSGSQSQGSAWLTDNTSLENGYEPLSSETRQKLTPNPLSRRFRDPWHGAFVRKNKEYFTPGRIFAVRWPEPVQDLRTKAAGKSHKIYFRTPRQMVVIKTDQEENSSTCVRFSAYRRRGLANSGLDLDEHVIVFDERLDEPRTRPDEGTLKGPPLAVCIEPLYKGLDYTYRINFGVTYTVKHNKEIFDVGHIAERSMNDFETYVAEALKPTSGLGPVLGTGKGTGGQWSNPFDDSR